MNSASRNFLFVRWSDIAATGVPLLANTPSRAGTAR